MPEKISEQLALPIPIREAREVYWLRAIQTEKRTRILGRRVLSLQYATGTYGAPLQFSISTDNIDKLQDLDLRYALRFQDAVNAAAIANDGHTVSVTATDEGYESQLLSTVYSGKMTTKGEDTFMAELYRCEPDLKVPGMSSFLVPDEEGGLGVRYWVRKAPDNNADM